MADFFFVLDSLLIYSLIGKIVTSITYNPEQNKLEITHLGTTLLKPKTETVDLENIIKHRRKSINPLIGYKQLEPNMMYATESMAVWHDRRFMDSIIKQPTFPIKKPVDKSKKKNKSLLD